MLKRTPGGERYRSLGKISINYLCVPFSEHFEQPVSIAQHVNGILLVRRFDGVFKPGGYAWICEDLFEGHTLDLEFVLLQCVEILAVVYD